MSTEAHALAGAILCGGLSRRMGRDKAGIKLEGIRLVERAAGRLGAVAAPIILACGEQPLELDGCLSVVDALPGRGPLGGVVAALRASPHRLCAVVAVDMPDLDPGLFAEMARCWGGEDAVIPVSPRGLEPLHALYSSSALERAVARLDSDDVSLHALLADLTIRRFDVAASRGDAVAATFAVNLNRPDDVTAWRLTHRAAAPPPSQPLRRQRPQR